MESPLTRQLRPDAFEPKIAELYRYLFTAPPNDEVDPVEPSEGFWREIFLLKPDKQKLYDVLEPLSADGMVHIQPQTRSFFRRAVRDTNCGISPRNENALENLAGYLSAVLSKRYTNPNTEIIEILAGLDAIDELVSELVLGLEAIIKQSLSSSFRRKAIDTALSMVSGSYQTSLVTYFIHRDLFPALMKNASEVTEPSSEILILLGLLANYNKFESQNMYQSRLEDFVNNSTICDLVIDFAGTCRHIRDAYLAVQDDGPAPWTFSSTLSIVGLRSFSSDARKPAAPTEEEAKTRFAALPNPEASILLSAYSFVQANRIFASHLISTDVPKGASETPLSTFLSTTSYLCHHAHRTPRALHYSELCILMIRFLIEDSTTITRLSSLDAKTPVRIARQRPPLLPYINSPRIPLTAILDILTDTLSHNLRKRISIPLYNLTLSTLHRLITQLDATRTRLPHHWSYIWLSLFSLLRFLTQYHSDLATPASQLHEVRSEICTPMVSVIAFCLSRGDNFLPDPQSYDDLFYKLIEAGTVLPKFHDAYCASANPITTNHRGATQTARRAANTATSSSEVDLLAVSTKTLINITSHYQNLLQSKGKRGAHQSPKTVQAIIREGYETLPDIGTTAGANVGAMGSTLPQQQRNIDFGYHEKWRESGWKVEIKKVLRTVVEDARLVALKS